MSYFKPLRRKFGVFTLVILSVVVAIGICSQFGNMGFGVTLVVKDTLAMHNHEAAFPNGIYWELKIFDPQLAGLKTVSHDWMWTKKSFPFKNRLNSDVVWTFSFLGIELTRKVAMSSSTLLFLPYWSTVIPLILLSTWLLLSKLRAKTIVNTQASSSQ